MDEKPNYYAVIPSYIRYDEDLTPNAKLLYGEISCLSQKDGVCWASNSYFANLYGVSNSTISVWIKSLVDKGYIKSIIVYKEGTKEIQNRYLDISNGGYLEKSQYPIEKNLKENNTSINNTSINNKEIAHKYGEYKNVSLTDTQLSKLKEEFPMDWNERIEKVSEYVQSTGKHYKDYLATIRVWARKDKPKEEHTTKYVQEW